MIEKTSMFAIIKHFKNSFSLFTLLLDMYMYFEMHRLAIHPSYSLNILAAIEQIVQMIITSTTKTSLAMFVSYFWSQNLPNW